ncbi:zf-HC2 domain-containing protein [Streptomyces sp. ActVer]|uniref:zf-HC2 domain-containing protein n=1 Tax=Streptomyces sp. ActVer TaxID=3014558 RepID=UPI0022B2FB35|nr:zf-HC2 domain-containing protein [Streptomyces sp. ActVer]MCZ4514304.1 zf-HC2 domain-containing protein [Streptomyces sp. ActVer]
MQSSQGQGDVHETVGAYALGILDDAEATAFEAHLATCEWCGQQLDELAGMEPMLAALADLPAAQGTPAIGESLAARPSPQLADRLVGEVVERRVRAKRSRRAFFGLAASLIIGGPVAAIAATGGDTTKEAQPLQSSSPAKEAFTRMTDKVKATDPTTKVSAAVGMEGKAWGTHSVLELKNVKGPEKCSLIAVGKNGERETATTWAVPKWGYGIEDAKTEQAKSPLYVNGGVAMNPEDIDYFEVMTFDGKKLVQVDV